MMLAETMPGREVRPDTGAPISPEPVILHPQELRQLRQAYQELLDLHHAEVVADEDFQDAHRLLVEQVLPLRAILRAQEHLVVDEQVELTY